MGWQQDEAVAAGSSLRQAGSDKPGTRMSFRSEGGSSLAEMVVAGRQGMAVLEELVTASGQRKGDASGAFTPAAFRRQRHPAASG